MLKEKQKFINTVMVVVDCLCITAAYWGSYFIRKEFPQYYPLDIIPSKDPIIGPLLETSDYWNILFVILPAWLFSLWIVGLYRSFRIMSYVKENWLILNAAGLAFMLFSSTAFTLKIHFVSRTFLLFFGILAVILLMLMRNLIMAISHSIRRKGFNFRNLLIVGTGPRAQGFAKIIEKHKEWGLRIVGLVDIDSRKIGEEFFGYTCISSLKNLPHVLDVEIVDEVVIVAPRAWHEEIQKAIYVCETQGIKVSIPGDLYNVRIAKLTQTDIDGMPMITFDTTPFKEWKLAFKRAFDAIVTFFGLILLSPLFITIAVIIKLTSDGPVFFAQERVGLNGRKFKLHKFRSMYKDAEDRLKELQDQNEMDGPVFKIKNDPRITPIGRFLRKTSMDELPQLFDVFIGNMSLVGPRPPLPSEVKQYEYWQKRRLSMRPGITCLWQVMGRNKLTFKRWMELDLEYIDNWSLWMDISILIKTVPVVLTGHGAS